MATFTELPDSFAAGTTVKYVRSLSDYPASGGWQLRLTLAGAATLTVTGAASGADHAMAITAQQSAALPAGIYQWAEDALKSGEVYRVAGGTVTVEPNLAAAQPGDLQSQDEKLLAAVTAVINVRMGVGTGLPKDIEAYQVDGVMVTKVPLVELRKLQSALSHSVARAKRGGAFGRQHRVTFTGTRNE
jgi:hypothetical protein